MSPLCSVNWYCARAGRPPMLITGGLVRNTRTPGTAAIFGRSDAMTSSAVSLRSARGSSSMKNRPPFDRRRRRRPPPPPIDDVTDFTFGSAWTIFMTCELVLDHRLVAEPLRHFGLAVDLADVLARDEAHRDDPEAVHRRHDEQHRDRHRHAVVRIAWLERPAVRVAARRRTPARSPCTGARGAASPAACRKRAGQHRRQRQRDEAGDQNRDAPSSPRTRAAAGRRCRP